MVIRDDVDADVGRRGRMSRIPFLPLVKMVKRLVIQCKVLYIQVRPRTSSRRPASVAAAKANEDAATDHNIE